MWNILCGLTVCVKMKIYARDMNVKVLIHMKKVDNLLNQAACFHVHKSHKVIVRSALSDDLLINFFIRWTCHLPTGVTELIQFIIKIKCVPSGKLEVKVTKASQYWGTKKLMISVIQNIQWKAFIITSFNKVVPSSLKEPPLLVTKFYENLTRNFSIKLSPQIIDKKKIS